MEMLTGLAIAVALLVVIVLAVPWIDFYIFRRWNYFDWCIRKQDEIRKRRLNK